MPKGPDMRVRAAQQTAKRNSAHAVAAQQGGITRSVGIQHTASSPTSCDGIDRIVRTRMVYRDGVHKKATSTSYSMPEGRVASYDSGRVAAQRAAHYAYKEPTGHNPDWVA